MGRLRLEISCDGRYEVVEIKKRIAIEEVKMFRLCNGQMGIAQILAAGGAMGIVSGELDSALVSGGYYIFLTVGASVAKCGV